MKNRSREPAQLLAVLILILIVTSFVLVQLSHADTATIRTDHLTIWTPATYVGVQGGIPTTRTNLINVTLSPYFADNTGAIDATAAINAALNAASSNDVVYLPAGNYSIQGLITLKNFVTLRGAGMTNTQLYTSGNGRIVIGNYTAAFANLSSSPIITAGADKGSTNLTTADTSSFTVGRLIEVGEFSHTNYNDQFVSPIVAGVGLATGGNGWLYKQMSRVMGKDATHLYIWPPLVGDHTRQVRAAGGDYATSIGAGLESLCVTHSNSTQAAAVYFEESISCWVKDVRIRFGHNYSLSMENCLQMEVRGSYIDRLDHAGSNGAGVLWNTVASTLFEDNIVFMNFPGIEINAGSCGNVVGYNFFLNTNALVTINGNHGPHNAYNLYEGNIANSLQIDGYFGSCAYATVYRNWIHGQYTDAGLHLGFALSLNRFTREFSYVGNVLGTSNQTFTYNGVSMGNPHLGDANNNGTNSPPWHNWGIDTNANGYDEFDTNVVKTTHAKGNFYCSSTNIPLVESMGGTNYVDSLYLTAKPAWWPADLQWPPVNPLNTTNLLYQSLPAGARFLGLTNNAPAPIVNTPAGEDDWLGRLDVKITNGFYFVSYPSPSTSSVLQVSNNLVDWYPVTTNRAPKGTLCMWQARDIGPRQFFRVRLK